MGAPINSFEIVESIRFFGSLVGSEGVSEDAKDIANDYIERLLKALEPSVQETTASSIGLTIVKS